MELIWLREYRCPLRRPFYTFFAYVFYTSLCATGYLLVGHFLQSTDANHSIGFVPHVSAYFMLQARLVWLRVNTHKWHVDWGPRKSEDGRRTYSPRPSIGRQLKILLLSLPEQYPAKTFWLSCQTEWMNIYVYLNGRGNLPRPLCCSCSLKDMESVCRQRKGQSKDKERCQRNAQIFEAKGRKNENVSLIKIDI